MKLILASNNQHKLNEVKALLSEKHEILSLKDINYSKEIPETASSLEGNAEIKALTIYEAAGISSFADDTGLEVEALNNQPGVYSARYAGEEQNSEKNLELLLKNMENISNRKARFRTDICLVHDGNIFHFEGIVNGKISYKAKGEAGFGYDPVFIPEGYDKSFAEMPSGIKNKISHRSRAVRKLIDFINKELD